MKEAIIGLPIFVKTVILVALFIFPIATSFLSGCRRKKGWLTWVVITTYIIGVVCPTIMGMIVISDAIYHFHYVVPDPALWGMACLLWLIMVGIAIAGGAWIKSALGLGNYPEKTALQN
ncbi:hypothetical protein KKE14_01695 [Patescibacteria group bacterium]|nr:hypothetical protein [Patescibacteria group bacterium]